MSSPSQPQEGPHRSISAARFYVSLVRRRRLPILLCLTLLVGLAVAYSLVQEPRYQGTAQVLLSRQSLANIVTGQPDPTGQVNDFIRIVRTQADLARTPELAQQVIRRTGSRSLTPEQLLRTSSVEPSREADLLTFKVIAPTKRQARELTTAYAQGFTDYRRALDTASLRRARGLLSRRIAELETDSEKNQRLISSLSDKEQQLRTLETLQTSNVTLVRRADRAEQVRPKPFRNVILGLFAGLALAAVVAGGLESLDTRMRSPHEIEERLDAPLLSRVPPPPPGLKGQLLMLAKPNSPDAEAFRLLRTTLRFATIDRPIGSLMVTSAIQGEGKSTTLSNLAVTLARAGQRVVLVDLDLRRPTIRRLFQFPPGLGLTDVIQGSARLADVLHEVRVPSRSASPTQQSETEEGSGSLKILAAGTPPHDPGEIVASPAIASLIGQAQEEADIVLIDAPPVLQVGDALALSAHVDAIFVCVRPQTVTRSMLDELRRVLNGAPAELLGAVVVGELPKGMDSYGGYGYGYEKGNGYVPDGGAAPEVAREPVPGLASGEAAPVHRS